MNETRIPPGPAASGLEARIDRIRQNIAAQQARIARGSMLTAGVGAIVCVGLAIWFYIGYDKIKEVMTPQLIVQAAESTIMESLPRARKELESKINDSADKWAAELSQEIQRNVPKVRQEMEEVIVKKTSEAFDEFQVLSEKQFRTFVTANQPMLADGFRSLKKPEDADRFVQDLHSAVEQQMAGDMRTQAEDMLHTLIDLNSKLDVLSQGERLNYEQALEREILMIARRLQLDSQASQPESGELSRPPVARRRPRGTAAEMPAESATAAAGTSDEQPAKNNAAPQKESAPAETKEADKPAEKPADEPKKEAAKEEATKEETKADEKKEESKEGESKKNE